jgi:transposase
LPAGDPVIDSLLKQARRFATRYEKTLRNYAAVVAIGCALLWLRI